MNSKRTLKFKSDQAGIASAVLCTIHCLIIPALFLLKFTWTDNNMGYQLPSWWEKLDYIFLLISFIAVYHATSHAKTKEIKVSLWIFWCILAIAIIFEASLHWMAYIASAGLVTTHSINIFRMRNSNNNLKKIPNESASV